MSSCHRRGHRIQHLLRLLRRLQEGLRDGLRMDALLQQPLRRMEQGARDDHHAGGAVAGLDVLRLGELRHHLRGGVLQLQLRQNGGAII